MNKRNESFQGMALSPIFIISVPPMRGERGVGRGLGSRGGLDVVVDVWVRVVRRQVV